MIKDLMGVEIEISDFVGVMDSRDVVVIDMRSDVERSHGNIPGSVHLESSEIKNNTPHDENKNYILCCSRGKESFEIATELKDKGFSNYYSLKGGYSSYVLYKIKQSKLTS